MVKTTKADLEVENVKLKKLTDTILEDVEKLKFENKLIKDRQTYAVSNMEMPDAIKKAYKMMEETGSTLAAVSRQVETYFLQEHNCKELVNDLKEEVRVLTEKLKDEKLMTESANEMLEEIEEDHELVDDSFRNEITDLKKEISALKAEKEEANAKMRLVQKMLSPGKEELTELFEFSKKQLKCPICLCAKELFYAPCGHGNACEDCMPKLFQYEMEKSANSQSQASQATQEIECCVCRKKCKELRKIF